MEIVGILTFVLFISILSGAVVLLLYLLNSGHKGKRVPLRPLRGNQRINIKFHQLALFFVLLCVQGILLFPWTINFNQEHIWMFLFLISIVIVSYIFIRASKGLDWKK